MHVPIWRRGPYLAVGLLYSSPTIAKKISRSDRQKSCELSEMYIQAKMSPVNQKVVLNCIYFLAHSELPHLGNEDGGV